MAGGDFPLSHLHASRPQDRIFLTLVNVDQSALGRGLGGGSGWHSVYTSVRKLVVSFTDRESVGHTVYQQ